MWGWVSVSGPARGEQGARKRRRCMQAKQGRAFRCSSIPGHPNTYFVVPYTCLLPPSSPVYHTLLQNNSKGGPRGPWSAATCPPASALQLLLLPHASFLLVGQAHRTLTSHPPYPNTEKRTRSLCPFAMMMRRGVLSTSRRVQGSINAATTTAAGVSSDLLLRVVLCEAMGREGWKKGGRVGSGLYR